MTLESILYSLFPDSRQHGREIRAGDIYGSPGGSFAVNVYTGDWYEHSTGEYGDLVDLVKARLDCDYREASAWIEAGGGDIDTYTLRRSEPAPDRWPMVASLDPSLADLEHEELGLPDEFYIYRNKHGKPAIVVARHNTQGGGKEMRLWTWCGWKWICGGTNNLKLPLYNLDKLSAQPDRPVIIVEGEKAANAAWRKLGDYVSTCPIGGSSPRRWVQWEPLFERECYVSGDNDEAGERFNKRVMEILRHAKRIKAQSLYQFLGGSGEAPRGWDIADGAF